MNIFKLLNISKKIKTYFLVIILLNSFLFNCTNDSNNTKEHFTDKMFMKAILLINEVGTEKATSQIDSIFNNFEFVSVLDRYKYYDFKRYCYTNDKLFNKDYKNGFLYVDSMIYIIKKNNLEKRLIKQLGDAYNVKSLLLIEINNLDAALATTIEARTLINDKYEPCVMADYYKNEGDIYFRMDKYNEAKNSFEKQYNYLQNCSNNNQTFYDMQLVLSNIGLCYRNLKNFEKSLKFNNKREKYIIENKNLIADNPEFINIALGDVYRKISLSYLHEKDFEKALIYIKKASLQNESIKLLPDDIYWYKLYYIDLYLELNQTNKALKLIKECDKAVKKLNTQNLLKYYKVKNRYANKTKQNNEEIFFLKKEFELNNTIENSLKNEALINPDFVYQKSKTELEFAKHRKSIQSKQFYFAIFILLSIASFVFLYFNKKNLIKKNKKEFQQMNIVVKKDEEKQKQEALLLQQINLELANKKNLILQKKKISKDLHDGVSGTLAALKYYLLDKKNNSITENEKTILLEIENEINTINENMRKFLINLQSEENNQNVDPFNFIKQIAKIFNKNDLLKIELNFNENIITDKLSIYEIEQLSYILTESVTNAIKHSNASILKVNIKANKESCQFSVIDNGQGFDLNNIKNGFGLNNLIARMNQLGGEIETKTSPNGTKVLGSFKLKK